MNPGNQETAAEKERCEKDDERRTKLMRSLAPLSYLEAKNRNKERLEGTCVWFTEHEKFQQWLSTSNSSFLFVSADPGCGKSVLSRYLVDSFLPHSDAGRILSYFFFKEDIELQASAVNALRCVLHQIFASKPELLTSTILNTFDYHNSTIKSVDELWNILLKVSSDEACGEVICVFDALDECPEKERDIFSRRVRYHFERQSSHSKLKVLITSRPYRHVKREILPRALDMETHQDGEFPVIQLQGESQEDVDKIAKEINIVIQAEVDNIGVEENWSKVEVDCVKSQLRLVPNRTYLWAHLTIDWLKKESGLRLSDFKSLSKRIPQTVDQAYERILCRARDRRPEILKLLQVVVAATRALTLDEMDFALSIRPDHKTCEEVEVMGGRFEIYIRDLCGLFVSIVDSKVYFLHQTAKEFLVQNSATVTSSSSWKHTLGIEDAHKTMFQICSSTMLALENHPREPDQPNYRLKEVYREKCALFDYSVDHFNTHYKSSAEEQYSVLDALLNIDSEKRYEDPYDDPLCFTMGRKPSLTRCDSAGTPLFVSLHFGWGSYTRQLLHSERHARELWIPSDCEVRDPLLIVAARSGDAELLRELLSHVDKTRQAELVNECDNDGETVLMLNCRKFDLECISFLIEAGADINAASRDGTTALLYACLDENTTMCEHLLGRGARLFVGELDKSHVFSKLEDKTDFLIRVLGEERMFKEFSPFYYEVYRECEKDSPLLRFCSINGVGYSGFTPATRLMDTSPYVEDEILLEFIDLGADILLADGHGNKPLWYCHDIRSEYILKVIFDKIPPRFFKCVNSFLGLLTDKTISQLSSDDRAHISEVRDVIFAVAFSYNNIAVIRDLYTTDLRQFHGTFSYDKHLMAATYCDFEHIVHFLVNYDDDDHYSGELIEAALTLSLLYRCGKATSALLQKLEATNTRFYNIYLSTVAFGRVYPAFVGDVIDNSVRQWLNSYLVSGIGPETSWDFLESLDPYQPPFDAQVDLLQRLGASINACDDTGRTALFHAEFPYIARELIKKGADIEARDNYGSTPFLIHVTERMFSTAIELANHGANINVRDEQGRTALFYEMPLSFVDELLEKGVDIDARDNNGSTPFLSRIAESELAIAMELVKRGADINARDKDGKTALYYAKSPEVVKKLLEAGADIEAKDYNGSTLLLYHIGVSAPLIAIELIKFGADVSQTNPRGETALRLAVQQDRVEPKFVNDVVGYGYIQTSMFAMVVEFLHLYGAPFEAGLLSVFNSTHVSMIIRNWPSSFPDYPIVLAR